MINEINSLLPLLDSKKDCLLISLLEQKKNKFCKINDIQFDAKDIENAKKGIRQLIHSAVEEVFNSDEYCKKLEKIASQQDCKVCKFSVEHESFYMGKTYNYKTFDNTRIGCDQCCSRTYYLSEKVDKIKDNLSNKIQESVTQEFIETKTLINIIQRKLRSKA